MHGLAFPYEHVATEAELVILEGGQALESLQGDQFALPSLHRPVVVFFVAPGDQPAPQPLPRVKLSRHSDGFLYFSLPSMFIL